MLPISQGSYIEREARNRSLGRAGEEFVVEYERWRPKQFGEASLATRVDWVSKSQGDGLGYDVLSFEADGTEKHIEVKTTAFDVVTPFFVSDNELKFARANRTSFQLYRLFEFRLEPKLFTLAGEPAEHCMLRPSILPGEF